mmetsp:Transcript_10579/g.31943  ORF Transcript_10579/g.31943 Transcript_10579/m.31943 type:complete len:398 (+) Transcript_10579:91-1284(+)
MHTVQSTLNPLEPIARGLEDLGDLRLRGALLRLEVVLPLGGLRERHEDALDAAARLEAEDSAAVVDEVELHVAAAAHLLPLLVLLRVLVVLVRLHDGRVGRHDGGKAVLGEGEVLLLVAVVLVIEEDATKAAGLVAVRDVEVLIGPLLELLVVLRVVLVAHVLVGTVEVLHVVLVKVRRGDVRAAAEPPDAAIGLEVAVVEMHRRRKGVARVHHGAQAAGEERHALARLHALGTVHAALGGGGEGLLRHGAVHHGQVAAGLLKDLALAKHAGDATAAALAHPRVLGELGLAVNFLNGLADAVLRLTAELLKALAHATLLIGALDERRRRLVDGLVAVPADAHTHRGLAGKASRAAAEPLGRRRAQQHGERTVHHDGSREAGSDAAGAGVSLLYPSRR